MRGASATLATAPLHQQEAVLLAHALVARVAEQRGARVLFIKGPTAVAVGARPDRPSSDVDVLVDPARFDEVCDAIERAGWQRRWGRSPLIHAADLAFDHSVHFIRVNWPADLDVHFTFPGFLAPTPLVFEALWQRRTWVTVAGSPVPTPDVLGQALLVGLHALRDPGRPRSREDLAHLRTVVARLSPEDLDDLARLAVATGCVETAGPLLPGAVVLRDDAATQPRVRDWRDRQAASYHGTTIWAHELSLTPWRARPGVLVRAIFPRRDQLVSTHLIAQTTRWQFTRLRLRRWRRGILGLGMLTRGWRHRS